MTKFIWQVRQTFSITQQPTEQNTWIQYHWITHEKKNQMKHLSWRRSEVGTNKKGTNVMVLQIWFGILNTNSYVDILHTQSEYQ